MKISLKEEDLTKLRRLLAIKELNLSTNEILQSYLLYNADFISPKLLEEVTGGKLDKEYGIRTLMHHYFGDEYLEYVNELGLDISFLNETFRIIDQQQYLDNPFYKRVPLKKVSSGAWLLKPNSYKPFEGFVYNDLVVKEDEFFLEVPRFGFFTKKFSYLEVYENGSEWMSITPNEIETMKGAIDTVSGNVVVFGLGLGYFAYMAARKNNVTSVTVIEKAPEVINLFKKHIYPYLDNKEKIKIIEADAFCYASKMKGHDYAFVDLWHDASDGIYLYLMMKKHEKKDTKYLYWIETSLLTMLRRAILIVIEDELNGIINDDYEDVMDGELLRKVSKHLREECITSYDDIHKLLTEASLKDLAKRLV